MSKDPVLIIGGCNGTCGRTGYLSSGDAINTSPLPDLPHPTFGNTLAAVGSKIYSCGGFRFTRVPTPCYSIDRSVDTPQWEEIVSLPRPMGFHTSVTINDQVWTVYNNKLYDLNTNTNMFHTLDLPVEVSFGHCAVSNGSHSFIIGAGPDKNEVWVNSVAYNPASWHQEGHMKFMKRFLACLWYKGSIFVTGKYPDGVGSDVFEPMTGIHRSAGTLVEGRFGHSMMVLDDKPAVVGGWNSSATFSTIETYDEATNKWERSSRALAGVRRDFGLVQLNG